MTRTDFRGAVEAPRPAAAWVMSIVASATLWITEQLPLWIIALQIVTFGFSYFTRHKPPAFRNSRIWLNIFIAGITTITIRSALDGNPATISLAYFTSLAQGLQLLDARPRKSEFNLVALALFQVTLASNLTDSILFPPLLVVFLATVTWTLLVHTLMMEATEAGDPAAASRAITSDLRRMTVVATCASLVLAGALFLLLPRLNTNMLRGGAGASISLSGFSERVSLGDVGRIRKDSSVVMRIQALDDELPAPSENYWRGLAFDEFDGTNWAISSSERVASRRAVSGIGRFGIELSADDGSRLLAQRIVREPVAAGVLFTPGVVQRIEGPFQNIELDRNGALYLPGRGNERVRYTIWGHGSERDAERLRADRATPPLEPHAGGPRPATRYLQLPPLDEAVRDRAREISQGASGDFERALSIRDALRETGRYTDSPPPLGDDETSPIEAFLLGNLEGHCEYFASAMVVLARAEGLPARLVNGFAGGVPNEVGGFIEVSRADAHAWVEIHFEEAGWVRFDPTPPDLRLRVATALSPWQRLAQVGSAIELWWFQHVVDFDSADQISALRGLWAKWQEKRSQDAENAPATSNQLENTLRGVDPIVFFAIFAGLLLAVAAWRRPRGGQNEAIPATYLRAQKILAKAGWERDATVSARAFLARLSPTLPTDGIQAFKTITEHYLAERFGARAPVDLQAELEALQNAVDRMRLGNQADVR